ncbi:hypothetical protein [Rhizobium sp. BK176]|uniref:hypothetical protein n=1 Tax=Rhizobium sp. BK176 TaxID=2587071 RepID=UPI002167319A|nr:hypothetical protein [Rhizobium sp. BK176]MCS4088746.1 hypothetical protein [Rhizobium sp. BK176]
MKIVIKDDCYTAVTREANDEEWSGEDTDTSHDFGSASLVESGDGLEVGEDFQKGDTAHLVIAVWSAGDSFSNRVGAHSEIMSAHKEAKNALEAKRILEKTEVGVTLPDGFEVRHIPWVGHFERLEYVTVEERILE